MARITEGSCGESLRALATTADGYTLDNPYGRFAIYTDVDGWRSLCRSLMVKVREHYERLGLIEQARAGDSDADVDYPQWNALLESFNAIVGKVNELDDVGGKWTGSGVTEAIAFCTDLAADQLCFIEQADAAIVAYGEQPPAIPTTVKPAPPPTSGSEIASAVTKVGLAAAGTYLLVNLLRRK